jgi:L-asparaginase
MKKVGLIFTGGTISMEIYQKSEGVIPSLSSDDIVSRLKSVMTFQDIEGFSFSSIPSPSMTPSLMHDLADYAQAVLDREDIQGVVISHGTDTLEETAYFLDLVLASSKPVVLTGSMKNASELGYDGLTNLVSSIQVVRHKASVDKGALVVMNYEIHAASEVIKTHTLNLDTFKTLSFGPLGIIDDEEVLYYRHRPQKRLRALKNRINDNVVLVKMVSGFDPDVLQFYLDKSISGIVIEALGRGNVPPLVMPKIQAFHKANIPVLIVTRCVSGRVLDTYGYPGGGKDLVRHGALLGGDLSGPKARLLLMVALGNQFAYEQIKQLLEEDSI